MAKSASVGRGAEGLARRPDERLTAETLLTAIHRHCLNCSGGNRGQVANCEILDCALYPFRRSQARRARTDENQITIFELINRGTT